METSIPSALVRHLTHSHSDHCPLLLELAEKGEGRLGGRPFRFKAAWTFHEDFDSWLRKEWLGDAYLPEAFKDLAVKLEAWNKATFGNIFRRRKRNELRLGGLQRTMARSSSNFLPGWRGN